MTDKDSVSLYVYRPFSLLGCIVGYDLYMDRRKIGRVKPTSAFEVRVPVTKISEIWARTEVKRSVILGFEAGKTYYLQCGIKWGFFLGRPRLTMINPYHGELEYLLVSKQIDKRKFRREYRKLARNQSEKVHILN
jgi:hypothetical protein